MDKHTLLAEVRSMAAAEKITKQELLSAFAGTGPSNNDTMHHAFGIVEILYYIGGAIVFMGIAVLISQHWNELSPLVRIFVTLGSGIAAYIVAVLFAQYKKLAGVSQAFFFLSALLLPFGLAIAFQEAGWRFSQAAPQSIVSALLLATYLSSYFVFRTKLFIVFSLIFGTWLFISVTNFLMMNQLYLNVWDFYEYRALAVGLSYIFLGYAFKTTTLAGLTQRLYSWGAFIFLTAAIMLGGWSPEQNVLWEALFPGLVFAFMFLSTILKSRGFLFAGSFYLMVFIIKITSEYFADSFGWPLALVLCGFALIGVGYGTFSMNNRLKNVKSAATSPQAGRRPQSRP